MVVLMMEIFHVFKGYARSQRTAESEQAGRRERIWRSPRLAQVVWNPGMTTIGKLGVNAIT
jgi:hypothetical protein